MKRASILCLLVACGGPDQPTPEPSEPEAPVYDLHEWGLLTVSANVVELAAGPGTQAPPPELVVEKPIIYAHASTSVRFSIRVHPGTGYALAERWPGSEAPIAWDVSSTPGACPSPSDYPTSCTSADGYCETRELAAYEASDASCLRVGDKQASLLFYRLRAEPSLAASLPVTIESGRATSRAPRIAWRVRRSAEGVRAWRLDLGAQATPMPGSGAQGAPAAAAWMHHELERRGLSDAERSAFERAWWSVLFGMDVVERPAAVEHAVEESLPDEDVVEQAHAPFDTLLYFLEDPEIAAIARLDATPAPRHLRRAFVVRHQL